MSRIYCSYFDHRYLPRGLAMIRSLRRFVPDAEIWVLCLSPEAERILVEMAEPGVHPVPLVSVEAGDAALATAKADGRSIVEYYFTLTPSLVLYVCDHADGAEIVTYLDGDLWFVRDPEPIYTEMADAAVLVIPHGFPKVMRYLEKFGRYNVGWVSFRNDARGRACLEWWRERSNEWCSGELDEVNGRYCEQRYLDYFAERFAGVRVLAHVGANLAPWNVGGRTLTRREGSIYADGDAVLFFHFHGLKRLAPRRFLTVQGEYKAPLGPVLRQALYLPYLKELLAVEGEVAARFGALDSGPALRDAFGRQGSFVERAKRALIIQIAKWRGYTVTVPD